MLNSFKNKFLKKVFFLFFSWMCLLAWDFDLFYKTFSLICHPMIWTSNLIFMSFYRKKAHQNLIRLFAWCVYLAVASNEYEFVVRLVNDGIYQLTPLHYYNEYSMISILFMHIWDKIWMLMERPVVTKNRNRMLYNSYGTKSYGPEVGWSEQKHKFTTFSTIWVLRNL